MQPEQFRHLLNSAATLIKTPFIVVTGIEGLWALLPAERRPACLDAYLEAAEGISISFIDDEDAPASERTLNQALGKGSSFHDRFGCYLYAMTPWDSLLPGGWIQNKGLQYLNVHLRTGKAVTLNPEFHALLALIKDENPLMTMQLILSDALDVDKLQELIKKHPFTAQQRWAINGRLREIMNEGLLTRQKQGCESRAGVQATAPADKTIWATNVIPIVARQVPHLAQVITRSAPDQGPYS